MAEVKTHCCGEVICSGNTVRAAVQGAVEAGVSLAYADLRGANLCYISFGFNNLSYADLSGANLRYTNLDDADLRGTQVHDVQVSQGSRAERRLGYG